MEPLSRNTQLDGVWVITDAVPSRLGSPGEVTTLGRPGGCTGLGRTGIVGAEGIAGLVKTFGFRAV